MVISGGFFLPSFFFSCVVVLVSVVSPGGPVSVRPALVLILCVQ